MFRLLAILSIAVLSSILVAQAGNSVPNSAKSRAVKVSLHQGKQNVTINGVAYTITVKGNRVVRVVRPSRAHGFAPTTLNVSNARESHKCYNCWYDEHGNWVCMYQSC
jgi:hypothetical protein